MIDKGCYLTFDMDWASDEVLGDFYDLIKKYSLIGTMHVTHATQYIDIFIKDKYLDCGIHPNYNFLLNGNEHDNGKNIEDILKNVCKLVPNATCVRSHALTTSSLIAQAYTKYGIKYELNTYVPAYEGLNIKAFKAPLGDYKVLPFIYEDDLYLLDRNKNDAEFYLSNVFDAPRIFNFHPIHLFLNTDKPSTYEKARPYFGQYEALKKCVNIENYGVRDFFIDLVETGRKNGWKFEKICEGDWE